MRSSDQSSPSIALGAVLIVLLAGAGLLALFLARSDGERTGESLAQAPVVEPPVALEPVVRGDAVEAAPERSLPPPPVARPEDEGVRCVRRAGRVPLEGVWVYVAGKAVAGPSGLDGKIAYRREGAEAPKTIVLWAPGLRPEFVHATDEMPAEVGFGPADAVLAVEIANLAPGREIRRSLIQPRAFPVQPDEPWAPTLQLERFGGYRAADLPPGAYDVYVWLGAADGTGGDSPALSEMRVLLKSGETTTVRLDADKAVDTEPDG